jgi:glycolate oxidase
MSRTALDALHESLPAGVVLTDPDVVEGYRRDRATFCPAGQPLAVVRARSTEQVSAVMRIATEHRVPVVPQGARSGLSGAANASDGCIVLSLEAMDQVLHVDAVNRYVVTQPGVMNAVLSRRVAEDGLFYPPDPSSWEFCSIGGNLATNSGGLCCVKYGVTTDYVLALEVVLADGQVLRTGRRTVKGVAGYDLVRLFVGSEGTLGVITEATLSLRPAAAPPQTVAATFAGPHDAAAAVAAVLSGPVVPSLLEFMDRASIEVVSETFRLGFGPEVGALVLAQSDAAGAQAKEDVDVLAELLGSAGAQDVVVAADPAEGELLLAARRHVLTGFESLGATLIDDVCVPRDRLADLVDGVQRLADDAGLTVGLVGHAGDGNFHPCVVFDPADPAQVDRAERLFDDIMVVGLELGGTITGEHGVGTLKRELLAREVGPVSMQVQRALKHALDPLGILNPGKVL